MSMSVRLHAFTLIEAFDALLTPYRTTRGYIGEVVAALTNSYEQSDRLI